MDPRRSVVARVLERACGARHGIVPPWQRVPREQADLPDTENAFVGGSRDAGEHVIAGGFGRTVEDASCAAIAEALERYAAHMARYEVRSGSEVSRPVLDAADFSLFSEEQRARPGFEHPYAARRDARYAQVYSLDDNSATWVPEELVGLGARAEVPLLPSTSTGLAAAREPLAAILRALEEVLERDALTVTWLASLGGREVPLPRALVDPVVSRGGEVVAFDITQVWNPQPVVIVLGQLPARGLRRYAMGAACRRTRSAALDKAWLEWLQGVSFAGHYVRENAARPVTQASDVRTFHEHGAFYTWNPGEWPGLPIFSKRRGPPAPLEPPEPEPPVAQTLDALRRAIGAAGARLFYRDLTLPDVRDVGLSVVRVLSPDLALLHGDERLPFLGGRARDVAWRYPDVAASDVAFDNRYPHPLG